MDAYRCDGPYLTRVGVIGVLTVKEVSTENALMSHIEFIAATSTTYSALGFISIH